MRILILEDEGFRVRAFIERFHSHDLKITENAYDAIDYLESEIFDMIFLDHDLGEGNGTGSTVSSYLRDNPGNENNEASIIIHSWNIAASKAMKFDLPKAIVVPFNTQRFWDTVQ